MPFNYNNAVERDVGKQTQGIIDVGLVAGGAKAADGTSVTFRPAGTASGKILDSTASVDVNNKTIQSLNLNKKGIPSQLKLKFPEKQVSF